MSNKQEGVDAQLVINDLLNQVAQLSREKAVNYALAVKYKAELDELKKSAK